MAMNNNNDKSLSRSKFSYLYSGFDWKFLSLGRIMEVLYIKVHSQENYETWILKNIQP